MRWTWMWQIAGLFLLTATLGCNSSSKPVSTEEETTEAAPAVSAPDDTTEFAELGDVLGDEASEEPVDSEQAERLLRREYSEQVNRAITDGDLPQAIAILQEAHNRFPDDLDIALSLIAIRVQQDKSWGVDDSAAPASFRQTAGMAREILGGQGEVQEEYRRLWTDALYHEARGYAAEGNPESAAESLQQAFEAGFLQYGQIDEDPFFASIRDNPVFQEVVRRSTEEVRARLREEARQEIAEAESFAFDFELPDLDAQPVKLADFQGKLLIVDIWGTWCPPCRMEIPHFIKLRNEYADDLEIVGVNYEQGSQDEVVQTIRDFVTENGINYACVVGDQDTQAQIPDFRGFPTTLLIDREGQVRLKLVGYHPYEKLDAIVTELISEGRPES